MVLLKIANYEKLSFEDSFLLNKNMKKHETPYKIYVSGFGGFYVRNVKFNCLHCKTELYDGESFDMLMYLNDKENEYKLYFIKECERGKMSNFYHKVGRNETKIACSLNIQGFDYNHPNISNNASMCLGNYDDQIKALLQENEHSQLLQLMLSMFQNHNFKEGFRMGSRCPYCNEGLLDDDSFHCSSCGEDYRHDDDDYYRCEHCACCNECCECSFCKYCESLESDCSCVKCPDCEYPIDEDGRFFHTCECKRCPECGDLLNDCECDACSKCGEKPFYCECDQNV